MLNAECRMQNENQHPVLSAGVVPERSISVDRRETKAGD
jgi:hypothetical protein